MALWKDIMNSALDAVLPRRERRMRTEARQMEDIPLSPMPHDLLGVRITTLMEYQNPAVEDLIRSLKYDGSAYAAKLAAAVLADYLREEISSSRTFSARNVLIVPVPLHKTRTRERGWNQIELVLRALPAEFRDGTIATLMPHTLARTRATKPQTRLPRSERLSNVAGVFAVSDETLVHDTHVFLIDDVTTTGATLANAATPLRRAGANVILLALARA
ncbi:ComF family protein [Candidatus Kaiserbacteria bacterium]|nr:ComF family protein [Candidatus Kaiserbacteria bacterium]